jgi:hypothetical protein
MLYIQILFYSSLPGGALVFVRIHGSRDIKAGHHIYIGQRETLVYDQKGKH